jgi:hypothetical protein
MFPAMTRVLALLLVMACADHGSPKPAAPAQREITAREKLPDKVAPLVPQHGIYAAGGGLTSAPWRVVVDDDAMTIYGGASAQTGGSTLGKLDHEQTKPLTPRNKDFLGKLASDAWTEPAPAAPSDPTADYDEILIVCDGNDCFFLEGFGPIRRPAAAHLIEMLRAAAGL